MTQSSGSDIAPTKPASWVPHFVRTNGIDLATYEAGTGLPVILLHGFPELAYSWRHQVAALAEAGWRAIAPDLRGYGETGPQGELASYSMRSLSLDVVGLMDALGLQRAVLVGHDFGGMLAWSIARDYPERVSGIISLNTPYTRRGPQDLVTTMLRYRGKTNYMVDFQVPGRGEALLERNVAATFHGLMRRPALNLADFRRADPRLHALPMTLFVGEPAVMGEPIMADEDLHVFIAAFEKTGFRGALNWYRNLETNWRDTDGSHDMVESPALMISASDDFFLPPETTHGMEAHVPDLERSIITECGHWTQHEHPDLVNGIILDWLQRRIKAVPGPG